VDLRRVVKISKYLARHLRHRPERIGLELDDEGRASAETARRVGARRGRPVVLTVDAAAMVVDGFEFRVSANGSRWNRRCARRGPSGRSRSRPGAGR
jgi:RNA:NAD 2'-phosphotransferase (TPT1/KptA family)